ncbi:hypothetical protein TWF730_004484 [Orbilia blumenaviensis]|uniref:Uncharacterized protein n=1 Tax=Orbilia blumenaviensis TaxID=1796055 RepID=A0AAV9U2M9_9PEZI
MHACTLLTGRPVGDGFSVVLYRGLQEYNSSLWTLTDDEAVESIPGHRYRKLIRHIRVDILDSRISVGERVKHSISIKARRRVRKMLTPLAYRLERVLSDTARDAEVEINVISSMFKHEYSGGTEAGILAKDKPLPARILNIYKELIETAWPFTAGSWSYKLNLPPTIEQQCPGLGHEIIRWCDLHNETTEEEKHINSRMKVQHPYVWAKRYGRHVVMEYEVDLWNAQEQWSRLIGANIRIAF